MQFNFEKLKGALGLGLVKKKGSVIGIDIGSSSIKVVQIRKVKNTAKLETYGELQLGPYADLCIGRATNLSTKRLTEALVDIVREASVTSRNGGLAISYASSFVTVITIPNGDSDKISSTISLEARKYIPVSISEVILDWFVLPDETDEREPQPENVRVLLAAIHKDALEKYKLIVSNAGLAVSFTEIEVFSTIRSSVPSEEDVVGIMDIGAASTKLYLVAHGVVQRTHSIRLGSQDMTSALSQSLQLPEQEAEELKRQVGLGSDEHDPRIRQAISIPLGQILSESLRVLEGHERATGMKASKIILTGGGSVLAGLETYATEIFGKPVVLADPFSKVEYPAFLEDTLKEAGPSFSVAMGIALRRLDE